MLNETVFGGVVEDEIADTTAVERTVKLEASKLDRDSAEDAMKSACELYWVSRDVVPACGLGE